MFVVRDWINGTPLGFVGGGNYLGRILKVAEVSDSVANYTVA